MLNSCCSCMKTPPPPLSVWLKLHCAPLFVGVKIHSPPPSRFVAPLPVISDHSFKCFNLDDTKCTRYLPWYTTMTVGSPNLLTSTRHQHFLNRYFSSDVSTISQFLSDQCENFLGWSVSQGLDQCFSDFLFM